MVENGTTTADLENKLQWSVRVVPAKAGIQEGLGPGFRRDNGNGPFLKNFKDMI